MAEDARDREHWWANHDDWNEGHYDRIQLIAARIEQQRANRIQDFLDRIWVTRDEQRIKVADMGDDHLINAYQLLRRRGRRRLDDLTLDNLTACWVEQLLEEIERRKLDKELQ